MDGVADRGAAWRVVQEGVPGGDPWDLYGDGNHVVYLLCTAWRRACAGIDKKEKKVMILLSFGTGGFFVPSASLSSIIGRKFIYK